MSRAGPFTRGCGERGNTGDLWAGHDLKPEGHAPQKGSGEVANWPQCSNRTHKSSTWRSLTAGCGPDSTQQMRKYCPDSSWARTLGSHGQAGTPDIESRTSGGEVREGLLCHGARRDTGKVQSTWPSLRRLELEVAGSSSKSLLLSTGSLEP